MLRFLVAVALLWSLVVSPVRADDDAALKTKLKADLARYLASRAKIEHISTASLSVSLKGAPSTLDVSTGTTAWGGTTPTTPANLFQIGSNTKAFTAVVLLQLEAEGKLNIEQTIGRWLPQYPAWKNVTIKRLLDMTSGIPGYDNVPRMLADYAKNPYHDFSPAELVAYVDPKFPNAPKPTSGYDYSNTNYILAEMIVERATGHSYESELEHRFLNDPKLADTYYRPSFYPQNVVDRMVSGYFFSTDPLNAELKPLLGKNVRGYTLSWARAAGGIVSSLPDIAYWSRRLYEGDLLPAKQRAELLSIVSTKTGKPIATTSAADPRGFGLGVVHVTRQPLGSFWFYQGETLGYRVAYVYFPKSGAVVVVGMNSQPNAAQDNVGQLLESVYTTLHAAGKL